MEITNYKTVEEVKQSSDVFNSVQQIYEEYHKRHGSNGHESPKGHLEFLQKRLEDARNSRSNVYSELKNSDYITYFNNNETIANTILPKKKNDDDVMFASGTIESKLDSLLSHVYNLNLSPDIYAFDEDNNDHSILAQSIEDIIYDTEIKDMADGAGDEEKKLIRHRELLKQGTVFVRDEWLEKFEIKKKLKDTNYTGSFVDFNGYEESLELVFEGPSRTKLYGPSVYLGDIKQFYMDLQPYVFTVDYMPYEIAKTRFFKFENFKYVRPNSSIVNTETEKSIYSNNWVLNDAEKDNVEVIIYEDKPNDTFQIIVGGVCMLPFGFPLSAVSPKGNYSIVKQVYRVISDKFAYGGSFVASGSVKEVSDLLDEMLRLFVLKTRKSITPAYANTSGRVISPKVLTPGRISMNIDPNTLVPISGNETQGITAGEMSVMRSLQDIIDKSTVSDQFTGQQGPAGTTATEVQYLQTQAQLTLGLTVAACMFLEKKLANLRLQIVLEHYFKPIGSKVVQTEDGESKIVNKYRGVNRNNAPSKGSGVSNRSIVLVDNMLPTSEQVYEEEIAIKKATGKSIKRIYINTNDAVSTKLNWYVVINAKPRESSPYYQNQFRTMLADILSLQSVGVTPNKDTLEEALSKAYSIPRDKLFSQNTPMQLPEQGQARGISNMSGVPGVNNLSTAQPMAGLTGGSI